MHQEDENDCLHKMSVLQHQLKTLTSKATRNSEGIFIFGDLQDTPDNSRIFHYGSCHITKHPLGIISACKEFGLVCTLYQHLHSMDKPIISRHGSKGGRFIDGMYTTNQDLTHVTGIKIIQDTGILSDHDMIINIIDWELRNLRLVQKKRKDLNLGEL
jgi:hypothetical protein